jgi:hypothetical protein
MRPAVLAIAAIAVCATVVAATVVLTSRGPESVGPRTAVVAELFTSEGCSSCPPADALLRTLQQDQPIPGAEVILLSVHVDYWNRLGWTDPFSSPSFTRRQHDYSAVFRGERIYTPQLVVDGRLEVVGSDAAGVKQAISDASRWPKALVAVRTSEDASRLGEVAVHVRVDDLPDGSGPVDIVLAITEDDLVTDVRRGENANRRLRHAGVVRRMDVIGSVEPGTSSYTGSQVVRMERDWKPSDLNVVAFVQDQPSRRILGAGRARLIPRD